MANKQLEKKPKKKKTAAKAQAKVEKGQVVRPPAKRRRGGKKKPRYTAETADKYELYQYAVQSPEADVEFLTETFRKVRRRRARHVREDFCGTALFSRCWLEDSKKNTAEGYDLDPECIAWGLEHNFKPLGKDAARCTLRIADVREPGLRRPDLRVAMNFSYQIFTERAALLEYFKLCYEDLAEDGILALDIHGGPESSEEVEEEKEIEEGFTYVWEQGPYKPVTGKQTCAIHFEFDDGTEMKNAFTYEWRLWTMPELRDLLFEAGFQRADCYFEGDDEDEDSEEGNGEFEYDEEGENCPSWIAYILGVK